MTGGTVDIEQAKRADPEGAKRARSSIEFPYNDQNDAMAALHALHGNAGIECTTDQLSSYLKQAPTGGAFRMRLSAARIFGLMETERGGKVRLTQLGQRAADPNQELAARAESFLTVPLYKAIFDKYKGYTLPPRKALEREIISLGVAPKQADRARQVFERSALQAGFFAQGNDRLVMPAFRGVSQPTTKPLSDRPKEMERHGGGGGGGGDMHPFIRGLLETLPEPKTEWAAAERAKWLNAAAQIFDLIYAGSGGTIHVSIAEDKSDGNGGFDS